MKDSYVYQSILDLISCKDLYYKFWKDNGDIVYSYTYIGDAYDLIKDYHIVNSDTNDVYDFILDSVIYVNQPFVINMTKKQYEDSNIYDLLLEVHPMILEELYVTPDPFNDDRLFIVYFNDQDFGYLYHYDADLWLDIFPDDFLYEDDILYEDDFLYNDDILILDEY